MPWIHEEFKRCHNRPRFPTCLPTPWTYKQPLYQQIARRTYVSSNTFYIKYMFMGHTWIASSFGSFLFIISFHSTNMILYFSSQNNWHINTVCLVYDRGSGFYVMVLLVYEWVKMFMVMLTMLSQYVTYLLKNVQIIERDPTLGARNTDTTSVIWPDYELRRVDCFSLRRPWRLLKRILMFSNFLMYFDRNIKSRDLPPSC